MPDRTAAPGYDPRARPARTTPFAWWSVALGVVGILPFSWLYFVPAICAVVCGEMARRQIRDAPQRRSGLGLARTGTALGVLGILLGLMVVVLLATGHWAWPSS